jgi:hypothetical protein
MVKLEDINKNLTFLEEEHKYFMNGEELSSVSSVLSLFKNEFDPKGFLIRNCARRDGITVEELRAKWDKERNDACERGHRLHSQLEHYIKNKEILDGDYKDVVKQFSKIKFKGELYSELQIYSPTYKIAGTTDLVELLNNGTINIGDFKQNKKIDKKSKYKNKLLYPLNAYDECEFETYTFQINLYSAMLKEYGYETNKMTLYYFSPATRKMEIFEIPKREQDTENLLKHFKSINEF